jgi:basic membrane protein A and related proteins
MTEHEQPSLNSELSRRRVLQFGAAGFAGVLGGASWLTACGSDDKEPAATSSGQATATTTGGQTTSGAAGAFRVGFAYVGPISDNGWTFTHDEARKAIEAEYSNVTTSYVESVPFGSEATQTFNNLAKESDLIIVCSEYADLLTPTVKNNPDKFFLECNGHTIGTIDNLNSYYVAHHKVAYIMGVAAGLLTKSGHLGYVGAFPTSTVYNDTNCFLLGARTVRPDCTMNVVLINSFFDPPKATQAATALIDGGADVLFDVMDDTSVLQVAEKRGVFSAIWNRDNRSFGPNAFINAIDLNWKPFYIEQVKMAMDGTLKKLDDITILDLGQGVDSVAWGDKVTAEAVAAGDAAKAKVAGGFEPYTGPIKDAGGTERVPAGKSLTLSEAYRVDYSIEGVTGVT